MAYAISAERRRNGFGFKAFISFITFLIESFFPALRKIVNAIRTFI